MYGLATCGNVAGESGSRSFFIESSHAKADANHAGRAVWPPISIHIGRVDDRYAGLSGGRLALEALQRCSQGTVAPGEGKQA
jgi:hypothetical protein